MTQVRRFIDRYALIIAMVIGVLGYQWFRHLDWLTSPLIFLMLFFTFCKINPLDLRLRRWHWIVLGVQLLLTAILLFSFHLLSSLPSSLIVLSPNSPIAQSLILCILMPTATAAPIIAGKLGGSIVIRSFLGSMVGPSYCPAPSCLTSSPYCFLTFSPSFLSTLLSMDYIAYRAHVAHHIHTTHARVFCTYNHYYMHRCVGCMFIAIFFRALDRLLFPRR